MGTPDPRSWPLPTPVHLQQRKLFILRNHCSSIGPSHSIQGRFQASSGPGPLLSSPKAALFPTMEESVPKISGIHFHRSQLPSLSSPGPSLDLPSLSSIWVTDSPFQIKLLLQEGCLGCGPGANSLKVFSSSSQRRTSTTKRLWKALTEALSCSCCVEGSVFWGGGRRL